MRPVIRYRQKSRSPTLVLAGAVLVVFLAAAIVPAQKERVIVLPFENQTGGSEFNWVGESIADALTDLLRVSDLDVVSNRERKALQQSLKIPPGVLPSLATALKIGQRARASLLIAGKYRIEQASQDVAAKIIVNASIIRPSEGHYLTEEFRDGTRKTREIVLSDAFGNLQSVQGQLAYQILYQRDKALEYSQNYFIEEAAKIPTRAFEAYIKGMLTASSDAETRANFLKNALRIYKEERDGAVYTDAAMELGHLFLNVADFDSSAEYFSQIRKGDPLYAEAAFYNGLVLWRSGNYEQALAVLAPLAEEHKLTELYNMLGAVAVEASRKEKRNKGRSESYLVDGAKYLKTAAGAGSKDTNANFNYGAALMLQGQFVTAVAELKKVTAAAPGDGEALFLLAKAMEKIADNAAAEVDDQARKALTFRNAYANLENGWKEGNLDGIKMRVRQPSRGELIGWLTVESDGVISTVPDEAAALLRTAQSHYEAGRDELAMETLRRVLIREPMSAESYLLLGKIHLRRADLDQAISSLKTALFWKNGLIDAHILLGRIFLRKRDCLQAKNYSRSALAIDSENPEAVGLERLAERCSR